MHSVVMVLAESRQVSCLIYLTSAIHTIAVAEGLPILRECFWPYGMEYGNTQANPHIQMAFDNVGEFNSAD